MIVGQELSSQETLGESVFNVAVPIMDEIDESDLVIITATASNNLTQNFDSSDTCCTCKA